MKGSRQELILKIIGERDVENQNQLIAALAEYGCSSTQATVSRDIRQLRLVKELAPNSTYRYAAPKSGEISNYNAKLKAILRECVTSFDHAQNIVVVKTLPGLASAACSALDSMAIKDLVGTLAGDDTAFLAMRDTQSAMIFCEEIKALL